jgi:hypothetical protein
MVGDLGDILFSRNDGIMLETDVRVELFEGSVGGVRTEREGVEARLHKVGADGVPDPTVLKPVLVGCLDQLRITDEEDAMKMVVFVERYV